MDCSVELRYQGMVFFDEHLMACLDVKTDGYMLIMVVTSSSMYVRFLVQMKIRNQYVYAIHFSFTPQCNIIFTISAHH
jgi:hypothetical protein